MDTDAHPQVTNHVTKPEPHLSEVSTERAHDVEQQDPSPGYLMATAALNAKRKTA